MKLVRESINEMPESDKELITQARKISTDETLWNEVYMMIDKAISKEAKKILRNISINMYHKEEGDNI